MRFFLYFLLNLLPPHLGFFLHHHRLHNHCFHFFYNNFLRCRCRHLHLHRSHFLYLLLNLFNFDYFFYFFYLLPARGRPRLHFLLTFGLLFCLLFSWCLGWGFHLFLCDAFLSGCSRRFRRNWLFRCSLFCINGGFLC